MMPAPESIEDDLTLGLEERMDPESACCFRLWAAAFQLGLDDAMKSIRDGRPPADEPRLWLYSDSYGPGSFTWLCDLFQIDDIDHARACVVQRAHAPKRRSMRLRVPTGGTL